MIRTSDLQALRSELGRSGVFEHRTARTWVKLLVQLGALGGLLALVAILPWWCALLLVPLAAVPAVSAAMIGHEAGHGSFSPSRPHNEIVLHLVFPLFGGLGAQYWKHKHNRLHHGNPNVVGRDPDVDVWPMALSSDEHAGSSRFRRWLQRKLQGHLFWPLTLLLAFTMRVDSWRYIAARVRERRIDAALLADAGCLLGHYVLWLAVPMLWFGAAPVLLVYAGLWATGGLVLALIFAPAHIGLPVLDRGERGGWHQQLETTRNLELPGWISWFFVGLDFQIEHHLFPRIPHQNLARASHIVAPWCAELGAPYHRHDYASSIRQVTRHMRLSWQAVPEVAMVKAKPDKLQTLTIGSRVFYPGHGVACVTAREEREFGAGKQAFYLLELEHDRGVKLMLPVGKVQQAGVRPLVSAEKARELMKAAKDEVTPAPVKSDPASRRLRATGYAEALKSGSPDRYTEIMRELMSRSRAGKLSAAEQASLNQALAMFLGEVGAALDMTREDVMADLQATPEGTTP